MKKALALVALILSLSACSGTSSRYSMKHDATPSRSPTSVEMQDPIPRFEPYSRQGNAPYQLFGQHYDIIRNVEGYEETGIASWYGRKFHGHLTSNGEYFDMFSMTAAHKTLPLPSYVRVTNTANGKQAIVRVNDRGPFHRGRIIDLSYAAAYRLGVVATGTAPVHIEVITQIQPPLLARSNESPPEQEASQLYIQLAAAQNRENLVALVQPLKDNYQLNATLDESNGLYRLFVGPFDELEAAQWLSTLRNNGYSGAFRVQRTNEASSFSDTIDDR